MLIIFENAAAPFRAKLIIMLVEFHYRKKVKFPNSPFFHKIERKINGFFMINFFKKKMGNLKLSFKRYL